MHGVVVLAIFGFCVVLAQSIAARRPLPAVLAVLVGAGPQRCTLAERRLRS